MREGRQQLYVVLPSLHAGGAERFVITLLQSIDRSCFVPTLVLFDKSGQFLSLVPPDVSIIDLNTKRASRSISALIKVLRKDRPELVFSTMGYLNLVMGLVSFFVPKAVKFIAREASHPSRSIENDKLRTIYHALYFILYRRFTAVIAQTSSQKQELMRKFGVQERRIRVIPNPLGIHQHHAEHISDHTRHEGVRLIAVGSLKKAKGFDLLLRAFSLLQEGYSLTIVGEGDERRSLEPLCRQLQLESRVRFAGFRDDVLDLMRKSDLYVLSSRYEGFPNVVLESLSVGTPVVAFGGPTSAEDIITDGFNGYIAEYGDIRELAEKIRQAASHRFDSDKIKNDVLDRYQASKIIKSYEKIFRM